MSFVTKVEFVLFLKNFRNIDLFQQGLYQLQIQIINHKPFMLLDQLGIKKFKKNRNNHYLLSSEIKDSYFYSSQFMIRYEEEEINLSEGCLFRIEYPTFLQESSIELQVDLLFMDSKTIDRLSNMNEIMLTKIASSKYVIQTLKQLNSNYLPISFDCNTACVTNCMIISAPLKIQYQQKINEMSLQQYLQKYYILGKQEQIINKTIDHLESILQQLIQRYKQILKEFIKEPSKFTHYLKQLASIGEFEVNNSNLQCQLDFLSQEINQIWYVFIDVNVKYSTLIMKQQKYQYLKELQTLYNDFVIKSTSTKQFNTLIKNNNLIESLRQLDQRSLTTIPIFTNDLLDNVPIIMKSYQNTIIQQTNKQQNQQDIKHLIVFVHGYKGSPYDLRKWKNIIKLYYPQVYTLLSQVNQRQGESSIRQMGHNLSVEIMKYIKTIEGIDELSFICHSIGGVVARSALTNLNSFANKMRFFISLGSPHIGLFVKQTSLVKTGLWFMTTLFQSQSMVELTLQDAQQIENTYLYYLSTQQCLSWFKKVILVGSSQDNFVPYEVARIERSERVPSSKQQIYNTMIDNIQLPDCTKVEVNFQFQDTDSNWDSFIGRTAHMNLVDNITMIRMIVTQCDLLET